MTIFPFDMLVSAEQLKDHFKIRYRDKLKTKLTMERVRFFVDRDGWPFTTSEALNAALGLKGKEVNDDNFSTDWMNDKA